MLYNFLSAQHSRSFCALKLFVGWQERCWAVTTTTATTGTPFGSRHKLQCIETVCRVTGTPFGSQHKLLRIPGAEQKWQLYYLWTTYKQRHWLCSLLKPYGGQEVLFYILHEIADPLMRSRMQLVESSCIWWIQSTMFYHCNSLLFLLESWDAFDHWQVQPWAGL